ncbi:MAG TPA: stimulus-sensing domain-containing protein [Thermoanaerobaculia bacterium]|nr:stimulus-sensing domain-containing protein [Thermoanaerobaculia bacterium]
MKPSARIVWRLLLFNGLLVFLPIAGVLSLENFERHLLVAQERSMVQQARLAAAALGGGELTAEAAGAFLARLDRQTEARVRVLDAAGVVIADSALLGPRSAPAAKGKAATASAAGQQARDSRLYRLGAWLYRLVDRGEAESLLSYSPPPSPGVERLGARLSGPEIEAALAGRYGAATRVTPDQRSLTLASALPVRDGRRQVVGAVQVSQSTHRILVALWGLRRDMFAVLLGAGLVAGLLTILFAGTISRPLERLRNQAESLVDSRGRLRRAFGGAHRADEIGDLARSLERLTAKLVQQVEASERFASDVAHEFKNPLASIRSAAEMLAVVEEGEDRERFVAMIAREVARLEGLLARVQELGRIDAVDLDLPAEPVAVEPLVRELLDGLRQRWPGPSFVLEGESAGLAVRMPPDRLCQILENLLDNAASFSPAGGRVTVQLEQRDDLAEITVLDQGPGIPEVHLTRIFDRFFTHRPQGTGDRRHDGLGLSLARALAERYGGSLTARNREGGGAQVELALPAAPQPR